MKKYVYSFNEGNKNMRNTLGGKGANLAEMTNLGLRIPKGFTISCEACNKYYEDNKIIAKNIQKEIKKKLLDLELNTHKGFGNKKNPLLVSVRSGARVSMPGMMDTILNLGLNDEIVEIFPNKRFAYDSYRRLIMMYADVVKGCNKNLFENIISKYKEQKKITYDIELEEEDLKNIVKDFKKLYYQLLKEDFPQNPLDQLLNAIEAVFNSWNNDRAIIYRNMNNISHEWGTAVNVQEMVYGNLNDRCATGVLFTRNPSTGENKLFGEYLINAQGEDIVAGVRTPQNISKLKEDMPKVYQEILKVSKYLEKYYRDMQDIEFTIENEKLYILQTRNGKRSINAAIKIVVDMVHEKLINKDMAILRIDPKELNKLFHPIFNEAEIKNKKVLAQGLAASPGAASGKIYFTSNDISNNASSKTILIREETSAEDIEGMAKAQGILTIRGGMTSHAAVVARGMGKCCICGCNDIKIDEKKKEIIIQGKKYHEGDYISLDGSKGYIYEGEITLEDAKMNNDYLEFMSYVDKRRKLQVRANADTPVDVQKAISLGASGIGLCRSEHMFFKEERIKYVRQMIIASTYEERCQALNKLLPMQQHDFEEILKILNGLPLTIRYLDPPLHEFLPKTKEEIKDLVSLTGLTITKLQAKINELKEVNPMMGHRGCRLARTYPEILIMQTKAIFKAAIKVQNEGYKVNLEIMIPLISNLDELKYLKNIILETINKIEGSKKIKYHLGTMIELPRAAINADKIAKETSFFSFGTNDLTQMTYGFSRDDAGKFLKDYYNKNILIEDPFITIDQQGVGELMKLAIRKAQRTNPKIKLGVCGEHGGEEKSIEFFNSINLDYVSCSAYRVPLARLAAAQAAIKANK